MSSLDDLPADQRAVLSLLLRQGRSYEQMTSLLAIAESAVRGRAQLALSTLGGEAPSGLSDDERARLGDYLLGQLGDAERIETLALLLDSSGARAWARRVSEQLAPMAKIPLPEVPPDEDAAVPEPAPPPTATGTGSPVRAVRGAPEASAAPPPMASSEPTQHPPGADRRGGAVLLAALVLLVAAIVVFAVRSGGSSLPPRGPIPPGTTVSTASSGTATGSSTPGAPTASSTPGSSTGASVLGEIRMSPTAVGGQAAGAGAIVSTTSGRELAFSANNLPSPGAGHYVLWLYDSPAHVEALGEIPSVKGGSVGPLGVTLPADASSYHGIVLSLETGNAPASPSTIVLRGTSSSPL